MIIGLIIGRSMTLMSAVMLLACSILTKIRRISCFNRPNDEARSGLAACRDSGHAAAAAAAAGAAAAVFSYFIFFFLTQELISSLIKQKKMRNLEIDAVTNR